MRDLSEIRASRHIVMGPETADGFRGWLVKPFKERQVSLVASWGEGWEHVSVVMRNRCPTWDEMCLAKNIFWREDECVAQFHPPKSEYVNNHPYCLHLWKPMGREIETPPKILAGFN